MRVIRYIGYGALGCVILTAVLAIAAFLFTRSDAFSGWATRYASKALGRDIEIANTIDIDWSTTPHIVIENVAVANTEGAADPHMLRAERLEFSIRLRELLKGRMVLPEVTAIAPQILLARDADGNGNWELDENPAGAVTAAAAPEEQEDIPIIGRLNVERGTLRYQDAKDKIDITLRLASLQGKAQGEDRIRLNGGGTYNGKPFRLKFTGGSILQLRESEEPYPLDADIRAGKTHVQLKGSANDIVQLKGVDIRMRIAGENAEELYPLTGIVFPPTPPYQLAGNLSKSGDQWRFQKFKGRMGNSDMGGDLTWDTSNERPMLRGNFVSQNLDMNDLGGLIGATPGSEENSVATEEQIQSAKEAEKSPYVIPETSLDIRKLQAMDADVVFNAQRVKTPDLLDKFHMTIKLDRGILKLQPIRFEMADGKIEGNLTIDGRHTPPHTTVDMTFSRLSLAELFAPAVRSLGQKNVSQGFLGGKAKLKGEGFSMHEMLGTSNGMVGFGMEGGQLSTLLMEVMGIDLFESLGFIVKGDDPTRVRCIIADFEVKQGELGTNHLLIDTEDTNVIGEGSITFRTEEVQLLLRPYPKDPSIFAATGPIRVRGRLKDLSVLPALENVGARGGIAAALGALLPPLAILAFIEPGLGKDSDCAGIVREMQAKTGGAIPVNSKPDATQ